MQVLMPDVSATNGYVHAISRVLFPPPVFTKQLAPMPEGALGDMPPAAADSSNSTSSEAGEAKPPASG